MALYHMKDMRSPNPLSLEKQSVVYDLCIVLSPCRVGSKMNQMAGSRSLASQYLPIMKGIMRQLSDDVDSMIMPQNCGSVFSGVPEVPQVPSATRCKRVDALDILAQDLRKCLVASYLKSKEKHLDKGSPDGLNLNVLRVASMLDIRFKNISRFTSEQEAKEARSKARALAMQMSERHPELGGILLAKKPGPPGSVPSGIEETAASLASLAAKTPAAKKKAAAKAKAVEATAAARAAAKAVKDTAEALKAASRKTDYGRKRKRADHSYEAEIVFGGAAPLGDALGQSFASVKDQFVIYDTFREDRDINQCPLAFWRTRGWRMPHIAALAQDILAIPGASHLLESSFSRMGRCTDPRRRPNLSASVACDTMFCHENVLCRHI